MTDQRCVRFVVLRAENDDTIQRKTFCCALKRHSKHDFAFGALDTGMADDHIGSRRGVEISRRIIRQGSAFDREPSSDPSRLHEERKQRPANSAAMSGGISRTALRWPGHSARRPADQALRSHFLEYRSFRKPARPLRRFSLTVESDIDGGGVIS